MPSFSAHGSIDRNHHSLRQLVEIAKRWGYACDVSSIDGEPAARGDDGPLVNGTLATAEMPCGIRFCASDLVAIRDNERSATLGRSLTVVLTLQGAVSECALGLHESLALEPGCAVAVAVPDSARIAGRYRRGERSRCLVVHACPSELEDDECADQIDSALRSPAAIPLIASSRLHSLANDLCASSHTGAVGRLLAESCALELLAEGLAAIQRVISPASCGVERRDVAKVMRVRDKLLTELDRDHSLVDLARAAGVSVSTLKSKFQAVVGQSVFAFLRDQRLERARQGLAREGWTVSQAAYFVGYRHPQNFATAFRRRFGIAPTETRR